MPFDGTGFKQPPDDEVVQILRRGREILEQGWCQGAGRTRTGVCLAVSLLGTLEYEAYVKAHMLLLRAIKETGFAHGGISEFNDFPGRRKEEVLSVCDRATELALS